MRLKKSIILLFIICTQLWAKDQLLHCLAREEENYHKEKTHHFEYKLNQELISQFVQMKSIPIKSALRQNLCLSTHTAFNTIYYLLTLQESFFDSPAKYVDGRIDKEVLRGQINAMLNNSHDIFFRLLSLVQKDVKDINCLDKLLPEWREYKTAIMYSQLNSTTAQDKYLRNLMSKIMIRIGPNPSKLYSCL